MPDIKEMADNTERMVELINGILKNHEMFAGLDGPLRHEFSPAELRHLKNMVASAPDLTVPAEKDKDAYKTFLLIQNQILPAILFNNDMQESEYNARMITRTFPFDSSESADIFMQELERVFRDSSRDDIQYDIDDENTITISYLEEYADTVSKGIDEASDRYDHRTRAMERVESTCRESMTFDGKDHSDEYIKNIIRQARETLKRYEYAQSADLDVPVTESITKCKEKAVGIKKLISETRAASAAEAAAEIAAKLEQDRRQQKERKKAECQAGIRDAFAASTYPDELNFMDTMATDEKAEFDRILNQSASCKDGALAVIEMRKLKEAKNTCYQRIIEIAAKYNDAKPDDLMSRIDLYKSSEAANQCESDYATRLVEACREMATRNNNVSLLRELESLDSYDIDTVYRICMQSDASDDTYEPEFFFNADESFRRANASDRVNAAVSILTTEPQNKTFAFDQMTVSVATKAANLFINNDVTDAADAAIVIVEILPNIGKLVSMKKVSVATRIMGAVRQFNTIMSQRLGYPVLKNNDLVDFSDMDMYLSYLVQFKLLLARRRHADDKLLDTPVSEIKPYAGNYMKRRKTPRRN